MSASIPSSANPCRDPHVHLRRIPRRLWEFQPKPRRVLLGRPAGGVREPRLLVELDQSTLGRRHIKEAGGVSLLLHLVACWWLLTLPFHALISHEEVQIALRSYESTPLIAPPPGLVRELTGQAPAPVKEVTLESLIGGRETPRVSPPPGPPRLSPPPAGQPSPRLAPEPEAAKPLVEPRQIERLEPEDEGGEPERPADPVRAAAPSGTGAPTAPGQPRIEAEEAEPPKLAFENVTPGAFGGSARQGSGVGGSAPRPPAGIRMPSSSVQGAIEELARGGGGGSGLVIGDLEAGGSISEARSLPPSQGNTGSSIEMLSDPKGVDFRHYLIQVLASVRRNWYAVMPASAQLGRRGKVVIQFAIDHSGQVPKLVIAVPSGAEPLDRAAVAAISASNPFPPLPAEYTGQDLRLQLNFLYNLNRR